MQREIYKVVRKSNHGKQLTGISQILVLQFFPSSFNLNSATVSLVIVPVEIRCTSSAAWLRSARLGSAQLGLVRLGPGSSASADCSAPLCRGEHSLLSCDKMHFIVSNLPTRHKFVENNSLYTSDRLLCWVSFGQSAIQWKLQCCIYSPQINGATDRHGFKTMFENVLCLHPRGAWRP